jgi:hypothetical protein
MDSEMALETASAMVSVHLEMVLDMVSELEMETASGLLSESKLIGHLSFEVIHTV